MLSKRFASTLGSKLRVPGDNVVVDPDLERLPRLAKAVRKERRELRNGLVHLEPPAYRKPRPITDAFQRI